MTIKKKLLTPAKFGLNSMKALNAATIIRTVNTKINSLPISPAAKNACRHMVAESAAGKPTFDAEFSGLTGQISEFSHLISEKSLVQFIC